jgi:sigma-B regulation protein RsbU (phosphoserine phosphatase)
VFYSRDVDREALAARAGWERPFVLARVLGWAMLRKLSPARRLLLVLAGILAFCALFGLQLIGMPRSLEVVAAFGLLLFLLALELSDAVSMKRDLELAREIQRWLLPTEPPRMPGVDIAFANRPANTVGGDFFEAVARAADLAASPDGEGGLLLAVADVAGKSVPAALLMANFGASLRALVVGGAGLSDLVRALNRATCARSNQGRRFVTAFLAEYEPGTRRLTYVSAGHNPPLLRRASGELEKLTEGGIPLGVDSDAPYPVATRTLAPGDLLVVYTDGVVDAVNEHGDMYGETRLLASVRSLDGAGATDALERLIDGVDRFVRGARQPDDRTWLVLRAE